MTNVDDSQGLADIERPNVARMYDYFLGGTLNYPADRRAAEAVLAHMPELSAVLRANREFLFRAVQAVAGDGVRQFLDVGSGIPAAGGVHEIARRVTANAKVAYIDRDPVVVSAGQEILAKNPHATMVHADLRDVAGILSHPQTLELIDLAEPVAVLLVAVLHFIPDDDHPHHVVSRFLDALPPGSYVVISHMSPAERQTPPGMTEAKQRYEQTGYQLHPRTYSQIEDFFTGCVLQPPGLVPIPLWRPDHDDAPTTTTTTFPGFAGVGRKPGRGSKTPAQRAGAPSSTLGVISGPATSDG